MAKKKKSDCPLYKHGNGQWTKKVRGKPRYFGTDKDAALKRWAEEKDYLLAGLKPPKKEGRPSIVELGNVFMARCRQRVSEDEITQRSADEYEDTIARLIGFVGRECRVENLTPLDFGALRARLSEPVINADGPDYRNVDRRAPATVAGDIRRMRAFFNWCWETELIEAPPRYGKEFSPPSRKVLRRKRAENGRRDMPAEAINATLAKAPLTLRAITLLGINGAVGAKDIAAMRLDDLPSLKGEVWLDLPRGKTGAPRRFVLWPETRDAIIAYLEVRPSPAGQANAQLLFLTKRGQSWYRRDSKATTDAIGWGFAKARKAAGVDRGSFYDLRRTFQTVAGEIRDREAVSHVMGHIADANDMSAIYCQHIDDDRLRTVCEHVRTWLNLSKQNKRRAG